jgi:hypothetical protein
MFIMVPVMLPIHQDVASNLVVDELLVAGNLPTMLADYSPFAQPQRVMLHTSSF